MTSVPAKVKTALAALTMTMLAAGMTGCGNELKDDPQNAPYVAPPPPPDMKPPPRQKGRPQVGVPLGLHRAPVSDLGVTTHA